MSRNTELIDRPFYLKKLIALRDTSPVKVITGLRRAGKSSLMDLFEKYLLDNGVNRENVIHMNLESMEFRNLKDHVSFYEHVSSLLPRSGRTYLLFDELQVVDGWEKAIESFRLDHDVDIYVTGSNAHLLSSEFSTLLSGRQMEIRVYPLSFKEFIRFHKFPEGLSKEEKFELYMKFGGMPSLREFALDEEASFLLLEGIYNTVMVKDVLARNPDANQLTLEKMARFLCSNIGSPTSYNRIGNVLSDEGDVKKEKKNSGISSQTASKYAEMLRKAYVFERVYRYDVKGKQLLKTLEKNYVEDLGIRNLLLGYRDADRGHLLENIAYFELKRRGYRVYVGKLYDLEMDFIGEKQGEKIYVQVCESMRGEEARARELRPLKMIKDNHPKIVLSMDRDFLSYDGIRSYNIIDWLLEDE